MLGGAPARTCCTAERLGECVPPLLLGATVTHRKHANQLQAGKVLGCGKGSASRAVDAKELHLLRSLAHHIGRRTSPRLPLHLLERSGAFEHSCLAAQRHVRVCIARTLCHLPCQNVIARYSTCSAPDGSPTCPTPLHLLRVYTSPILVQQTSSYFIHSSLSLFWPA
jgi:hypothetical protein